MLFCYEDTVLVVLLHYSFWPQSQTLKQKPSELKYFNACNMLHIYHYSTLLSPYTS